VNTVDLFSPWATVSQHYCVPSQLTFKMALGEAPEHVPALRDVRLGVEQSDDQFDGGPVRRILHRFSSDLRVTRVHTSAMSLAAPGHAHRGFDDVEHALGLSRIFRMEASQPFDVEGAVDALRQFACVESASPLYLNVLPFKSPATEPCSRDLAWQSREQINASEAMAYEPGDPAVIVGLVDTGVAFNHPELHERLRSGFDTVTLGSSDLAQGMMLLAKGDSPGPHPDDRVGHGTSCAAIIGGRGENIPPGLAIQCGLLPMQVLGAVRVVGREEPVGVGAIPDIDHGLKLAIDLGAKVLNLSFGTPVSSLREGDPLPHEEVIRYALARGCVLIAASGNSGTTALFSPACLEGVIAVGAVDAENRVTSFTTRGAHVALCAPGLRVATAGLSGYQLATGTSFAAPFVSATSALMISRALRRSKSLDAATVKRLLVEAAQPHARGTGEGAGVGILDAHAALAAVDKWADQNEE
jgi:subtilisin family serine protease